MCRIRTCPDTNAFGVIKSIILTDHNSDYGNQFKRPLVFSHTVSMINHPSRLSDPKHDSYSVTYVLDIEPLIFNNGCFQVRVFTCVIDLKCLHGCVLVQSEGWHYTVKCQSSRQLLFVRDCSSVTPKSRLWLFLKDAIFVIYCNKRAGPVNDFLRPSSLFIIDGIIRT